VQAHVGHDEIERPVGERQQADVTKDRVRRIVLICDGSRTIVGDASTPTTLWPSESAATG